MHIGTNNQYQFTMNTFMTHKISKKKITYDVPDLFISF